MRVFDSLTGHLLIAMPGLTAPAFKRSVVLICEHGAEGALGLVVNRPLQGTSLGSILARLDLEVRDTAANRLPVLVGDPVERARGFVIHEPTGHWMATLDLDVELGVTTSVDVLSAIAVGRGPARMLIVFGYAGWRPGQLEQEISEGTWLSGPVSPDLLFEVPFEQRWPAAAAAAGIDLRRLVRHVGHA